MIEASSKNVFSAIATALLLGGTFFAISAAPRVHAASNTVGVVIPLYSYPTSGTWTAVEQTRQSYNNVPFIAVVSPASGPGTSQDSNFVQGIRNLQSAGITVLGYVDTAYGSDSVSSVENNVNLWKNLYAVNGIFFDEMNNVPGYESYYATLGSYVKSVGMTTSMGNPGTSVPDSYIGTLSILNVYETGGYPSLSFISYPGYSTSNFAIMGYGVSLSTSFITSASSYAAWEYFTDGSLPNPYGTLPSYFTSEVAAMSAIDSASTTTTTTTSSGSAGTVSVSSVSTAGGSVSGLWTTWSQGGTTLSTGFTPTSFSGKVGSTYTVAVSNYGSDVFCHWQDGTTAPSYTFTLQASTTLTAYYSTTGSCPPVSTTFPLNVDSVSTTGSAISGLYTIVTQSGSTLKTGFTPLSFTATSGNTYTITVENYGLYTFSHWSNGSTDPTITVTPTSGTTLTAYYNVA